MNYQDYLISTLAYVAREIEKLSEEPKAETPQEN